MFKTHLVGTERKEFSSLNLPPRTRPMIWKTRIERFGPGLREHRVGLLMADEVTVAIKAGPAFTALVRSPPCGFL